MMPLTPNIWSVPMQRHSDRSLREGGTRRRGSERKEKTHLQAHASLAVGPY